MLGDIPDRPTIQLEDNIIVEVDYLTDHGESSTNRNNDDEEEEESDWDASTLSLVAYTPQRAEIRNEVYPGFSPLQPVANHSDAAPVRSRGTTSDFLASFKSPPERKVRRAQFESYGVDNRTRTPHYSVSQPVSVDEFINDDEEDDESMDSNHRTSNLSYGASKYLGTRPSLAALQRQSKMSMGSPANKSMSSIQTSSSMNSRRYSMMSHRSSTSMSLLFGEVINLEDQSRFTARGDSANAQFPHPIEDIDLEQGLEGLEIGGGTRPVRGHQGIWSKAAALRHHVLDISQVLPPELLSRGVQQVTLLGQTATRGLQTVASKTRRATQRVIHSYRPPLSPHARALEDLEYLQQAHKEKVGQLKDTDMEDHYDFVLLLKPQEVYRFWADILDFRVEHLGDEFFESMEPIMETASTNSTHSSKESDDGNSAEFVPLRQSAFSTPLTGMRRRARTPATEDKAPKSPPPACPSRRLSRPSYNDSLFSPNMPCNQSFTSGKLMKQRLSMFEKAVGFPSTPVARTVVDSFAGTETPTQDPRSAVRRRWGNRTLSTPGSSTANILSLPVRSLTRGSGTVRKQLDDDSEDAENVNPNRAKTAEDFPNPVIPRGIAARTNGMLPFLSALKRGIVLRRHRANKEAIYCKIFSNDGGDTIQYQLIDAAEAMVAFKEQRVRYNRNLTHSSSPVSVRASTQPWACIDGPEGGSLIHKFNVPDHVAAHRYREKLSKEHGLKKHFIDLATKAANSGIIRTADIVAVHPAWHPDPRHPGVRRGDLGTSSLRKSKSEFRTEHSFSIVVNSGQRFGQNSKSSKPEPTDKWYKGEGNELQFKTLDFEAATKGECWLIFRGFLFLHRDAVVGRFAAERRAGISGGNRNNRSVDDPEDNGIDENLLHQDEFLEPATVGVLERTMVNLRKLDKTYMEGAVAPTAVPPPSDYFLGFKSPGTQVRHQSCELFFFSFGTDPSCFILDLEPASFGRSRDNTHLCC